MITLKIEQWLPAKDWQGNDTKKAVKTLRVFGIQVYKRELLVPSELAEKEPQYLNRSYLTQF